MAAHSGTPAVGSTVTLSGRYLVTTACARTREFAGAAVGIVRSYRIRKTAVRVDVVDHLAGADEEVCAGEGGGCVGDEDTLDEPQGAVNLDVRGATVFERAPVHSVQVGEIFDDLIRGLSGRESRCSR